MIKAYRLKTDSDIEPTAKSGTLVYDFIHYDYGCASEDTRYTGITHRSVTLQADGGYPFFTHPVWDMELVESVA